MEKFQLNLAEFSRNIDVKLDTIYSIFYEKTKGFSVEIFKKLIKVYPEISPFWLITGEGDMIVNNTGIIQHHNGTATATQSANLDKLIELSSIDEPTHVVSYNGNRRIEKTLPKYELLTTHCAHRTFVVTALQLGIPAEVIMRWTGHSDFAAMKPYIAIVDELKARSMALFNVL